MMNYNYDVLSNTLTVSEKFLKNAGRYNSPEYNVVKKLRADYPTMQIVVEKKQKSGQKSLTFKQMEGFIQEVDAELLPLFEKVKKLARFQSNPYKYVNSIIDVIHEMIEQLWPYSSGCFFFFLHIYTPFSFLRVEVASLNFYIYYIIIFYVFQSTITSAR